MTQEDKQLLLKDLCGRLPYGVICHTEKGAGYLCSINQTIFGTEYGVNISPVKRDYFNDSEQDEVVIKPFLHPMSSMTEEEKEVLERLSNCFVQTRVLERGRNGKIKKQVSYLDNEIKEIDLFGDNDQQYNHISQQNFIDTSDFFNFRHIDYRGLIEKGLALEAKEGMYKTE